LGLSGFRQKGSEFLKTRTFQRKEPAMTTHQLFAYDILERNRVNIYGILKRFTPDQLNRVPEGFSNNLIWNAGHVLVTQQLLVHSLSGSEVLVSEDWIRRFRKGSRPEKDISREEIYQLMEALLEVPKKSRKMAEEGRMSDAFKDYETSFGITLHNLEEAIHFNNIHEGMHFGSILALRKMV
jgi:hypothetical protein